MKPAVRKHHAPTGRKYWVLYVPVLLLLSVAYLVLHHLYPGYQCIQQVNNESFKEQTYFWLGGYWVYLELFFWLFAGSISGGLVLLTVFRKYRETSGVLFPLIATIRCFYIALCAVIILFISDLLLNAWLEEPCYAEKTILIAFLGGMLAFIYLAVTNMPGYMQTLHRRTYAPGKVNVSIGIFLDSSNLFEDVKIEVLQNGFDNATVSLQCVDNGDIITAVTKGANQFIAGNIPTGKYIIRALHSQRLADNTMLNLFGEQTVYIHYDEQHVELAIKKYDQES